MSEDIQAGEDTKKKSKKKAPAAPLLPNGAVFYADAGAKPNPGFAGWGIHGYLYNTEPPKKGSGNALNLLTGAGYVTKVEAKLEKPIEVTPITYVDGFSALPNMTNNAGEVVAATKAMEIGLERDVKHITIRTDSKYVVVGATDYLPKWVNNNWVKADGQPVANTEFWKSMYDTMNKLKEKDITVNLEWIRGHNGNLGNCLADNYATIGRRLANENIVRGTVAYSPAEGYWNEVHERHPFIHHSCSYLTTAMAADITGEYYLGHHGKEDDLVGKRDADGAYAYVQLKEVDEYIELVKAKTRACATRDDNLILCRLDKLYEKSVLARLKYFGEDCLYRPNKKLLSLNISEEKFDEEPITTELNPPRIAVRAVESLNMLKGLLLDWRNNPNTELVATDITSLLYEKDEKGVNRLKACYTTGFTALPVKAHYGSPHNPQPVDLTLAVGLDLPERNSLKKLEKLNPTVKVITWREADKAIRYAGIVEAGGDYGIWAAFYSNLKYLA